MRLMLCVVIGSVASLGDLGFLNSASWTEGSVFCGNGNTSEAFVE